MAAFMVAAWYCYVRAEASPRWGWGVGLFALLAFFTKAAAAFFVAAVGLDAVLTLVFATNRGDPRARGAAIVILSLVVFGVLALAVFVVPNWDEYWFYNVQMSITRKPSYDLESLVDRITWFPVLHDLFTRMWFTLLLAVAGALGLIVRWREASPAERLLGLVGGPRGARADPARRRQRTPIRLLHPRSGCTRRDRARQGSYAAACRRRCDPAATCAPCPASGGLRRVCHLRRHCADPVSVRSPSERPCCGRSRGGADAGRVPGHGRALPRGCRAGRGHHAPACCWRRWSRPGR